MCIYGISNNFEYFLRACFRTKETGLKSLRYIMVNPKSELLVLSKVPTSLSRLISVKWIQFLLGLTTKCIFSFSIQIFSDREPTLWDVYNNGFSTFLQLLLWGPTIGLFWCHLATQYQSGSRVFFPSPIFQHLIHFFKLAIYFFYHFLLLDQQRLHLNPPILLRCCRSLG